MKSKCSFILKASTALVLALLMLFGTVATSVAAVVENTADTAPADADTSVTADTETVAHGAEGFFSALRKKIDLAETGRKAELAETGDANYDGGQIYFDASCWSSTYSYVYLVIWNTGCSWNVLYPMTRITNTKIYYISVPSEGKNGGLMIVGTNTQQTSGSNTWTNRTNYNTFVALDWVNKYTGTTNWKFTYNANDNYYATAASGDNGAALTCSYSSDGTIDNVAAYKKTQYARVYKRSGGSGDYTNVNASSSAYGTLTLSGKQWNNGTSLKSTATSATADANTSISDIAKTSSVTVTTAPASGYTLTAVRKGTSAPTTTTDGSAVTISSNSGSYTVDNAYYVSAFFDETMNTVTFAKKLGTAAATTITTASAGVTTKASYTAPDETGYNFTGWVITDGSGNATNVTGTGSASDTTVSLNATGAVTVTAMYAGVCAITAKETNASGEVLSGETKAMTIGSNLTVYAEGNAYHSSGNFSITTSNASVADISANSVAKDGTFTVYAKGTGTATITISCSADSKSTTFDVSVSKSDLAITIAKTSILIGDNTKQATYSATPSVSSVAWSSADTSKFTVTADGTITPVAAGTANLIVTATFDNGGTDTATKSITIVAPSLTTSKDSLPMDYVADTTNAGSDYKGTNTFTVSTNANDSNYSSVTSVTVESSDTTVVTVSPATITSTSAETVTATSHKVGSANIIVKYFINATEVSSLSKTIPVTVSAYDVNMTLYVQANNNYGSGNWSTDAYFIPHSSTNTGNKVTGGTPMTKIGTVSSTKPVFALNITKKQYTDGFVIGQASATRTSGKRNTVRVGSTDPSKNLITITDTGTYFYGGSADQSAVTITKPVITAKANETLAAGETKAATAPTVTGSVSTYLWTSGTDDVATISGATATPTITGVEAGTSTSSVRAFIPLENTGITFSSLETDSSDAYDFISSNLQSFTITVNDVKHTVTVQAVSRDTASGTYANNNAAMASSSVSPASSISYNDKATVSATAAAGYVFTGFYTAANGGTQLTGTGNNEITVTDDVTVYARFEQKYTLTLSKTGQTTHATVSPSSVTQYATVAPANVTVTIDTGYELDTANCTDLSKYFTYTATTGTVTLTGKPAANINSADKVNATVSIPIKAMEYTVSARTETNTDDGAYHETPGVGGTFTISQTGTVNYNTRITMSASAAEGYTVVGIYRIKNNGTWEKVECTATSASGRTSVLSNNTYDILDTSDSGYTFVARFAKIYHITPYNSYVQDKAGKWHFQTPPPMTVVVTTPDPTADENATKTYTYKKTGTTPGSDTIVYATGFYGEANKLQVLAGDTVQLNYSALASSDNISGVFYVNNKRYSLEDEPDNKYIGGVPHTGEPKTDDPDNHPNGYYDEGDDDWKNDYLPAHTLYAEAAYYDTESTPYSNIIGATYDATVNQATHSVSWTVKSDYLNIDVELATKKRVYFSETDNIKVHSVNTDNYYYIGETLAGNTYDGALAVKAAGTDKQTNTITVANVKIYKADEFGAKLEDQEVTSTCGITVNVSPGATTSFANSGATDSTAFLYLTGTMPTYNIYVDLDLAVTYQMYLGSYIVSDTMADKTRFRQVANITAKKGSDNFQSISQNNTAGDLVGDGPDTANKGDKITYSYSFTGSWASYYMFNGWYLGDSTGPDLKKGFKSSKDTYTLTVDSNTYIYAVGTRDLFINGCKEIIGGNTDWPDTNIKMDFDPSYYNTATSKYGRYYYEIDQTTFESASKAYNKGNGYFTGTDGKLYWTENGVIGNSRFSFFDTATKSGDNKTYWRTIDTFANATSADIGEFGLVRPRDKAAGDGQSADYWAAYDATGFIVFDETSQAGYTAPITIYAYPGAGLSVSSTPIWPHIYVSNGYKNVVANDSNPSAVSIQVNGANSNYESVGTYTPKEEGTVTDYRIKAKNATVTFSKTISNTDYLVSNYVTYNLRTGKATAYPATKSGTTYTASVKMEGDEPLYVFPVIEHKDADLTVTVNADQMNTDEWGDLIGCYAWYSNSGGNANGAYPAQLMVPSADGKSWSTKIKSTKGSNQQLMGVLFSNCYNGNNDSWLGCSGVLGDADGTLESGELIDTYNSIDKDGTTYDKTNFKCQTYDYREPVAFFENRELGATEILMNFSLKEGNADLVPWQYSELTENNILTYKTDHPTWKDIYFEHLVDASGTKYADLNGMPISGKPTPTFYVVAKGMNVYKSGNLKYVFHTGQQYNQPTGINYPNKGSAEGLGLTQSFAVQWYVYDATGKYITTMLSAGIADKTELRGETSLLGEQLMDLGYAVDGKAVDISYDVPRYCYDEKNSIPNTGTDFNAYRFTGQWYYQSAFSTTNVYAQVGMLTDNGEPILPGTSTTSYGSASASVDLTKIPSHAEYAGTGTEDGVNYAYAPTVDGGKQPITLTASAQNFQGWYYYDSNKEFKKFTDDRTFSPTYGSQPMTFYAMYAERAIYSYQYQGRESTSSPSTWKSYGVDGGYLTEDEMTGKAAGCVRANQVATDRTDFGTKTPGDSAVSIFKRTLTWDRDVVSDMLDNSEDYTMKITNSTLAWESFDVTAYYKDANGDLQHQSVRKQYNQTVNFNTLNGGAPLGNLYGTSKFVGWYEYDPEANDGTGEVGALLSLAPNYGMVAVKKQEVIALYENDTPTVPTDDAWHVFIDDQAVTKELYGSDNGTYYNDVIVRVRNNHQGTKVTLPAGAQVGALIFDNGGVDGNTSRINGISNTTTLTNIANAITNHGGTAKVGSNGIKVTKLFGDSVTQFGRVDLAMRGVFGGDNSLQNHKYAIYPYIKLNDGTYSFLTTPATGTYD